MNNDKILQMMSDIGAVAECTREMYRQLKKQGFMSDQAFQLTQTWMAVTFRSQPQPPKERSIDYDVRPE